MTTRETGWGQGYWEKKKRQQKMMAKSSELKRNSESKWQQTWKEDRARLAYGTEVTWFGHQLCLFGIHKMKEVNSSMCLGKAGGWQIRDRERRIDAGGTI